MPGSGRVHLDCNGDKLLIRRVTPRGIHAVQGTGLGSIGNCCTQVTCTLSPSPNYIRTEEGYCSGACPDELVTVTHINDWQQGPGGVPGSRNVNLDVYVSGDTVALGGANLTYQDNVNCPGGVGGFFYTDEQCGQCSIALGECIEAPSAEDIDCATGPLGSVTIELRRPGEPPIPDDPNSVRDYLRSNQTVCTVSMNLNFVATGYASQNFGGQTSSRVTVNLSIADGATRTLPWRRTDITGETFWTRRNQQWSRTYTPTGCSPFSDAGGPNGIWCEVLL